MLEVDLGSDLEHHSVKDTTLPDHFLVYLFEDVNEVGVLLPDQVGPGDRVLTDDPDDREVLLCC